MSETASSEDKSLSQPKKKKKSSKESFNNPETQTVTQSTVKKKYILFIGELKVYL